MISVRKIVCEERRVRSYSWKMNRSYRIDLVALENQLLIGIDAYYKLTGKHS